MAIVTTAGMDRITPPARHARIATIAASRRQLQAPSASTTAPSLPRIAVSSATARPPAAACMNTCVFLRWRCDGGHGSVPAVRPVQDCADSACCCAATAGAPRQARTRTTSPDRRSLTPPGKSWRRRDHPGTTPHASVSPLASSCPLPLPDSDPSPSLAPPPTPPPTPTRPPPRPNLAGASSTRASPWRPQPLAADPRQRPVSPHASSPTTATATWRRASIRAARRATTAPIWAATAR